LLELPQSGSHHSLKNIVGTIRYNITKRITDKDGKKSKINEKKSTSAMKNNDPGNPKKISKLISTRINNLVLNNPIEDISVINLVLNLLFIQSTNKKKFVDKKAWLTNIQKPARNR
jgi:hypothetical protein